MLGDRNDKRRIMGSRRANRPESKLYNRLYGGELRECIINPRNDMNALREGSDERRYGG